MGEKGYLQQNTEIKLIVEKNLEIIDVMKKLNQLLVDGNQKKGKSKNSVLKDR